MGIGLFTMLRAPQPYPYLHTLPSQLLTLQFKALPLLPSNQPQQLPFATLMNGPIGLHPM